MISAMPFHTKKFISTICHISRMQRSKLDSQHMKDLTLRQKSFTETPHVEIQCEKKFSRTISKKNYVRFKI